MSKPADIPYEEPLFDFISAIINNTTVLMGWTPAGPTLVINGPDGYSQKEILVFDMLTHPIYGIDIESVPPENREEVKRRIDEVISNLEWLNE